MTTARRSFALFTVALLALLVALPVSAVDEPETTETTGGATETTAATEQEGAAADVPPPAVTVPPEAGDDEPADWTYRYLIPTLLALAVLVVIITTVQYFVRVVRSRYKVVE